jgi:hypothetical protein
VRTQAYERETEQPGGHPRLPRSGGTCAATSPRAGIVLGRAFNKLLGLEQGWIAGQRAGDLIDD